MASTSAPVPDSPNAFIFILNIKKKNNLKIGCFLIRGIINLHNIYLLHLRGQNMGG